jgi:hypothetical protein
MRIVKLSYDMEFEEPKDVEDFFEDELPNRSNGRFRITKGRIRSDGLEIGEEILFSFEGRVYYIARAASERLENHDEFSDKLPYYFEVDRSTLRRVRITLDEIEQRFQAETGRAIILRQTRGWPEIQDQPFVNNLWRDLARGS